MLLVRNVVDTLKQEENLCSELESVSWFIYLGDMESAGGKCEAAVTASIRCGWVK